MPARQTVRGQIHTHGARLDSALEVASRIQRPDVMHYGIVSQWVDRVVRRHTGLQARQCSHATCSELCWGLLKAPVNQILEAERPATARDRRRVPIVMGFVLKVASSLSCPYLPFKLVAFSLENFSETRLAKA